MAIVAGPEFAADVSNSEGLGQLAVVGGITAEVLRMATRKVELTVKHK